MRSGQETHAQRLRDAGVGDPQSEAILDALGDVRAEFLDGSINVLRDDIATLRTELVKDFERFKYEIRTELKEDISALDTKVDAVRTELKTTSMALS